MSHYNINDVKAQEVLIRKQHGLLTIHAASAARFGHFIPVFDLDTALWRMRKRVAKHRGERSKYKPHQGTASSGRHRWGSVWRRAHGWGAEHGR